MASLDQIREQLQAAGHPKLPPGHPTIRADGKPVRYGPKKKFWYSIHEIERAGKVLGYTGAYGCWTGDDNGAQTFQWQSEALTQEDLAAAQQRQDDVARREAEQRSRAAKNAANRAKQQWSAAQKDGESEYFTRKQITPESVRFGDDGDVLVPMIRYSADPVLVGLQKITQDGAKRFNKGMDKVGAACRLGDLRPDDKIALLGEGYATSRTVRMAVDEVLPVFVCFDAGNLLAAARLIRESNPGVHLLFCADDDWKIEQRLTDYLSEELGYDGQIELGAGYARIETRSTWYNVSACKEVDKRGVEFIELRVHNDVMPERIRRFENAGLKRAYEAAHEIGNASVVVPRFANRGDRKLSDFNDMHVDEGLQPVKAQIEAAVLAALAPKPEDVVPLGALRLVSSNLGEPPAQADSVASPKTKKAKKADHENQEAEQGEKVRRWQQDLRRADRSGAILPALDNTFLILTSDPRWQGVLGFEEFSNRVMKVKAPPFEGGQIGEWTDRDDARCVLWLGQHYQVTPRSDTVMDAVFLVSDRHRYHVVKNYLNSVQWDRKPRLKSWIINYLGAADSEYVRLIGYKWLMGAVGRVMQPGCKMDNVLILEGAQDAGKSAVFRTLFGAQWFTDANIEIGNKDAFAAMAGKWVIELAELDALSKADSSLSKRFFSTAVDTYRPPYGKRAIDVPRQSVFGGSVNFDTYLKDESGGRRYWPTKTASVIDLRGLAADRDQIWAEAYTEYLEWQQANQEAAGMLLTPWQVTSTEKPLFELEQYARYEGDEYENLIRHHLIDKKRTTMGEILADVLKLEISKWTMAEQRRVGKALKSIGWERKRESSNSRNWYYQKPELTLPEKPFVAPADQRPEEDDAPL